MSALCTYLLSTAINLTTNAIPLAYPDMKLTVIHHNPVTVTNVTTGDNHRGCPTWDMLNPDPINGIRIIPSIYHVHEGCSKYVQPTEKWERTLVERIEFMDVIWRGKTNRVENREVVSDNTLRWRMESEWKKVEPIQPGEATTTIRVGGIAYTNLITATNINITVITQMLWKTTGPNLTNGVFVAP